MEFATSKVPAQQEKLLLSDLGRLKQTKLKKEKTMQESNIYNILREIGNKLHGVTDTPKSNLYLGRETYRVLLSYVGSMFTSTDEKGINHREYDGCKIFIVDADYHIGAD